MAASITIDIIEASTRLDRLDSGLVTSAAKAGDKSGDKAKNRALGPPRAPV
jgi:hypothetical protein